jgi:hypothetical protein
MRFPGIERDPPPSDPEGWSTRPRHLLGAMSALPSRAAPPARLGRPAKLRFSGPPSQAGLVDVVVRHDGARHDPVAEECESNVLPEPGRVEGTSRMTIRARRPAVPCPHAHGLAWPHRDRLLTTLMSASKVRGE